MPRPSPRRERGSAGGPRWSGRRRAGAGARDVGSASADDGPRPSPRKADHPAMPAAILSSMMTTDRRFGAQSMTAPLRDVLVKRPGPAFGAAFDDPAHGFLPPGRSRHRADASTTPSSTCWPRSGPTRPRARHRDRLSPDLVYTFDPLLVTDRGAIPLRPGKPNRAPEPAAIEAWTTAAGIPTVGRIEAPGHDRGRRHVLAAAGPAVHRPDAAHERRRARASWRPWSAATFAIFDVPYWRGPGRADPPAVGHLAGRRRPRRRLPAAAAGRAVGSCSASSGSG